MEFSKATPGLLHLHLWRKGPRINIEKQKETIVWRRDGALHQPLLGHSGLEWPSSAAHSGFEQLGLIIAHSPFPSTVVPMMWLLTPLS